LRKAIRTAGYGTAPFLAYMTLLGLCYDDDATVQVTWRALQARSGGMANATLDRALKHLERHGWLARERDCDAHREQRCDGYREQRM